MNITTCIMSGVIVAVMGIAAISVAETPRGSALEDTGLYPTTRHAQTTDAETTEGEPVARPAREGPGPVGILLLLLLLIGATLFYFLKIQRPSLPDFPELTGRDSSSDHASSSRSLDRQRLSIDSITSADKSAFQQLLTDVYRAWSKGDLQELRQFVTPDMLNYFSAALADHTSQHIRNHVEDVMLLRAEITEAWTEQGARSATAKFRWSARTYDVSLTKQPGDPGYVVKGSETQSTESTEVWTFTQSSEHQWLLSGILQAR